jgi:hypothetical protein
MKWPRFLQGSTTPPPRLLDEDEQSPAAALLRAARLNGPPPPAGAQERAMAALDRAAAEAAETVQEAPDGAKVFEGTRRPRRWSRTPVDQLRGRRQVIVVSADLFWPPVSFVHFF